MTKYEKLLHYSQCFYDVDGVQGVLSCKEYRSDTGLEEKDETGNWKCQNDISK